MLIVQHNMLLNTLRPEQNGCHFSDDIFKCIFLNENAWISIKISLKLVRGGPNNNFPALVRIMAWRWPGDKPLSELKMVSLLTHIWVTQPQWFNEWGWYKINSISSTPGGVTIILNSVAVNYRYSRYKIDMKISIDNRYGFSDIDISSF